MKLPSLQLLIEAFNKVLRRFPMVLLSALTGTVVAILLTEGTFGKMEEVKLIKVAMVSSLGLPLFFAVHLFCEKWRAKPQFTFIALVTALFLLVQFYFSMAPWQVDSGSIFYRFFFWSAGLHLVAAFSVFFVAEELNGFWQFNKQLFLRFLTAALYSCVLYLGLGGALLAIDQLFSLDIHNKLYADLWLVIAGMFNTIFFLGGIEEPVEDLNNNTVYPKGLKIFTQYVLLPLVNVYLLILYAYMVKILVQQSLPQGWVANLILGFSVTGILSLLLVWPLRGQSDNKWVKAFSRFFYFSLLPLITLLFVAIGTRIRAYGVTIDRYIVAMLGVWLTLITLYFIFSKRKNIILIPLTLALFLFGSCFGPWGMFAVAERSQVKRLSGLLERNGILVNGKLVRPSNQDLYKIEEKDAEQINSIIDYLAQQHSLQAISGWMSEDCRKKIFTEKLNNEYYNQAVALQKCIGLFGYYGFKDSEVAQTVVMNFYSRQMDDAHPVLVSGYSSIYNFKGTSRRNRYVTAEQNNVTLNNNVMSFQLSGNTVLNFKLDSLAAFLIKQNSANAYAVNQKPENMTVYTKDVQGKNVKIMFEKFYVNVEDSSVTVNDIDGYLLR